MITHVDLTIRVSLDSETEGLRTTEGVLRLIQDRLRNALPSGYDLRVISVRPSVISSRQEVLFTSDNVETWKATTLFTTDDLAAWKATEPEEVIEQDLFKERHNIFDQNK